METTPSSSLTRYRPIILALTGFAAIYGAILVYKNVQNSSPAQPVPGIHRSNAVHRPRRPLRSTQTQTPPQQEDGAAEGPSAAEQALDTLDFSSVESYGRYNFIDGNEQPAELDLRPSSLPTLETFQQEHSMSEEAARSTLAALHREMVGRFMMMHFRHREYGPSWQTEVFAAARWLERIGISSDEVRAGVQQMVQDVEHAVTQQQPGGDGREDDADTIAGTEVGVQFGGRRSGLNLKQLLYHIAENSARQDGYLHRGFRCDSCGTSPIRGTRWKCANCVDLDLCNECHATCMHARNHIFYEIKIPTYTMNNLQPVQELSYPGLADLSKTPHLSAELCKSVVQKSEMEKSEVEGLYDQFVCLATVPLQQQETGVYAINRETFPHIISPMSSYAPLQLNLVFDRLFALFDTDKNDLIDFTEFVMGVRFLRTRSSRADRWRKTFDAYDIDGDGIITRTDCLRMFRALYQIQKDLTMDFVCKNESINGLRDATAFAQGGRVISAAFNQNPRTTGENRPPLGKVPNPFGDVRDQPDRHVVEPNGSLEADPDTVIGHAWESQAQFPFDATTGEPCSLKDFLYLAPRDARGNAPSHVARDQRVRLTFDGRPLKEVRADAIDERKSRRGFYDVEVPVWPQDLVVEDYEIPAPKHDYAREIAYQVMEDALNELLDPLFKDKEDLEIEARAAEASGEIERFENEINEYMRKKAESRSAQQRAESDPLMAVAAAAEEAARLEREEEETLATSVRRGANGRLTTPVVAVPSAPTSMDDAIVNVEAEVQAQQLGELLDREGFGVRSNAPSPSLEAAFTDLDVNSHSAVSEAEHPPWPEEANLGPANGSVDPAHSHHLDISTQPTLPPGAHATQAEPPTSSLRLNPPPVFMTPEAGSGYTQRVAPPPPGAVTIPNSRHWVNSINNNAAEEQRDPTMPQFRPNSVRDIIDTTPIDVTVDPMIEPNPVLPPPASFPDSTSTSIHRPKFEAEIIRQFEYMFLGWERDPETGIVRNSITRDLVRKSRAEDSHSLTEQRLQRLVELKAWLERGGERADREIAVGLTFEEFEGKMKAVEGGELRFMEGWLEVCYF